MNGNTNLKNNGFCFNYNKKYRSEDKVKYMDWWTRIGIEIDNLTSLFGNKL